MKGAPKSDRFDDIYFSAQDGLAETRHVFMQGNDLPSKWQEKPKEKQGISNDFVICETGFGTGLNFLCAWSEFERYAAPNQRLHFISFEQFPLSSEEIKSALEPWLNELSIFTEKLVEKYPMRVGGFHRMILSENIILTLIFGDVNEYISELEALVDCWFLDGFTPAKNPEMWTDTLFQNMARLSHSQTSFATFTAAGFVRRGLEQAGFSVEKKKGFGHKRDMIAGRYVDGKEKPSRSNNADKKIAIIGGGLAGTACAYILRQYGLNPTLYEASSQLADRASGNDIGLINPRFSALKGGDSEFYTSAYAGVTALLENAEDVDYNQCGTVHLINTPEKEKRFSKLLENWDWHEDHIQILSKAEASSLVGVSLDYDALYLPQSATVSPKKLCHYYAKNVEVRLDSQIKTLEEIDADIIILANGMQAQKFIPDIELPIHTVRGQVTYVKEDEQLQSKTNICYGGYTSAPYKGLRAIGSSFQRWLDHTDVLDEDDHENIKRMKDNVSVLNGADLLVKSARAGLRVSSQDRFPIAGKVPQHDNIFITTAHGSHGIVSSYAAAHLIADQILGGPVSLPASAVKHLSLQRFLDRAQKKNNKKKQKKA